MTTCPQCGCSDHDACQVHGVACCWIEIDGYKHCSACASVESVAGCEDGRRWLERVSEAAVDSGAEPYVPCGSMQREGF